MYIARTSAVMSRALRFSLKARVKIHACRGHWRATVIRPATAKANKSSFDRGHTELTLLLRRGLLDRRQTERATLLANRLGVTIESREADPQIRKYGNIKRYVVYKVDLTDAANRVDSVQGALFA